LQAKLTGEALKE